MHGESVEVSEVFTAIQGESSWAGYPCFFVRLAGCNLRCGYCDTPQARGRGRTARIAELAAQWRESRAALAEITGGEPLLQPGFPALAAALRDAGPRPVLVETNGSQDLARIPEGVMAIVDVKCPGSGAGGSFAAGNLGRLRPADEVKFVIADRADYEWARAFSAAHELARRCRAVLFSPAAGSGLAPAELAAWIVEDGLPVRLQVQLHRLIGMR